jgi:hypothetical protein
MPEQHHAQGKDGRADPDDQGDLPFRVCGRRLFHNAITAKRRFAIGGGDGRTTKRSALQSSMPWASEPRRWRFCLAG